MSRIVVRKGERLTTSRKIEILGGSKQYDGSIKSYCAEKGISVQNFYRWKRQYGDSVAQAGIATGKVGQPVKSLSLKPSEDIVNENERLKIIIAELYMERERLRSALDKSNCQ